MKNFLNKEIKLCLSTVNYLFLLFPLMLIIPNYPCYVGYFYICLSIFFIFQNSTLNKDIPYSMILPITKKEIVKSRCILIGFYEIIALIIGIPLALIYPILIPEGNTAGIESNFAFFGFQMIILAIFNFILFTTYYKKAEKPGVAFVLGSIAYFILTGLFEFPIWIKNIVPYFEFLDSREPSALILQLPVLLAGIIIYFAGWIITYKVSSKKFEKVDL